MHADHATFVSALEQKRLVKLTFHNTKTGRDQVLTCAPLDFGPLRGALDASPRYQLWNAQAKRPPFNVTALPNDVQHIEMLETTFEPETIITWKFKPNAWSHARDWGNFS
jgi:hypothetical protein